MTTIQKEFNIDILDYKTRDCAGIISKGQLLTGKTHTIVMRQCHYNPLKYHFCFYHQIKDNYIVESIRVLNNMFDDKIVDILKKHNANKIFLRLSTTELKLIYEKGVD